MTEHIFKQVTRFQNTLRPVVGEELITWDWIIMKKRREY